MKKLNYFGTGLTSAGHYFWELEEERMNESKTISFKDIPFDPEHIITYKPLGTVEYSRFGEYMVCAIEGSCTDERPGSHSIFWTTEQITYDDFKEAILSIPSARKIIDQMSFKVNW